MMQNWNDVEVSIAACCDLWFKNIKDTLQQIKCNVGGENNRPSTSVYAGSSFEGTTEQ